MLPHKHAWRPAFLRISAIKVDVVVFPLLPVTAMPLLAAPITVTFLFLKSKDINLAYFQRGYGQHRQDNGQDPKTDDDLIFIPSGQLQVMMKGRHFKNTFSRKLKRKHLQDHG